jgi:hypothetical protein
MGNMTSFCGTPSYVLQGGQAEVQVSVQGGHMTGTFLAGGKRVSPHWVAPWWKEAPREEDPWIVRLLRGDFFCFPFGGNAEPYGGLSHALHGRTANDCWDLVARERSGGSARLTLRMDLEPGEVEKSLRIDDGSPVIYISHVVSGHPGKAPVGHHPTLDCGDVPGAAIIDLSEPLAGFTLPSPVDIPENKGYALLESDTEVKDRRKVPTVYGGVADLTRYPVRRGHEDGVIYLCDASRPFSFTSVSFPSRGYLYFQLKNPSVLHQTIFWMCDGGRYGAPFSGRATGVLGAEEITGYFFGGIKPSVEPNPLSARGSPTCLEFSAAAPRRIPLIVGVVPIPAGFTGVKDITAKDGATVTIQGRGGEKIDVPCRTDFLAGD